MKKKKQPKPISPTSQFSTMSREQLEQELLKGIELLKSLGATYYTKVLTVGEHSLPPHIPIPIEWLRDAHDLMDGNTLEDSVLGQLYTSFPQEVYNGYFEDRDRIPYVFTFANDTKASQVRTTSPAKTTELKPEVLIWLQSVYLATGITGKPNKLWYLLQALSSLHEQHQKTPLNLGEFDPELLKDAHIIVKGGPLDEELNLEALEDATNSTDRDLPHSGNSNRQGGSPEMA